MITTGDEGPGDQPDPEFSVTHFIPSVRLKGTRADKLETLDLLIAHLEGLRRSLAEQQEPPAEWRAAPSMHLTRADRWWGAGFLIAAAVVLVVLGVRACARTNESGASVRPQPEMARLLAPMPARVQFPRPFDDHDNRNGKFSARSRELFHPRVSRLRSSRILYRELSASLRRCALP